VYRDRSQTEQVLVFGDETDAKAPTGEPCPECGSELHGNRRCVACLHCGWSRCG